jgi:hypothetical protein
MRDNDLQSYAAPKSKRKPDAELVVGQFPVNVFLGMLPISMGTISISWHQRKVERVSWLAAGGLLL